MEECKEIKEKIHSFDGKCSFCLEYFKEGDELVIYDCGHYIHSACLDKGIKSVKSNLKTNCPNCRAPVKNYRKLKKGVYKPQEEEEEEKEDT